MERGLELQLLLDHGDQHMGGDCAPDLRFSRVLAVAREALELLVNLPQDERSTFKSAPDSFAPEPTPRAALSRAEDHLTGQQ